MKRLLKITLLMLFIGLTQYHAYAQRVAGYMGKRFFVGIPVSYMPNIYGFVNQEAKINYNGKNQFYMLNALKVGASVGLVTSNLRSVVLDVDFQNTGVAKESSSYYNFNGTPSNFVYGRSKLISYKLRVQNAFQHCAPVGGYKGITLGLTTFNNSYINEQGVEVTTADELDFSIGYAGGLRRVYKDKIVVDLGLEYNMFVRAIGGIFDFESEDKAPEETVGNYAIKKNGLNSIIVCKAAIYLLL